MSLKSLLNVNNGFDYNRERAIKAVRSFFKEELYSLNSKVQVDSSSFKLKNSPLDLNGLYKIGSVGGKLSLVIVEAKLKDNYNIYTNKVQLHSSIFNCLKNEVVEDNILLFTHSPSFKECYRISYIPRGVSDKADRKRYSFMVGKDIHGNNIPTTILASQLEDTIDINGDNAKQQLLKCFALASLEREFYTGIKNLYNDLDKYCANSEARFLLLARIMFIKFLTQKKYEDGTKTLGDYTLLTTQKAKNTNKYYEDVLYPLFFRTINQESNRFFEEFPYLNGGLFEYEPNRDDSYKKIPNEWFEKLFKHLEQYHFTLDENSFDDVEVSLDPELLGNMFEGLLKEFISTEDSDKKENEQKGTGSFYTPKEIVQQMVENSIKYYLQENLEEQELKQESIDYFICNNEDKETTQWTVDYLHRFIEAIDKITILDPACGSGAYPIGMLDFLSRVYEKVYNELKEDVNVYEIKNNILKNNIFGLDIQPIATEITRLRAFIDILLSQKPKSLADIKPLPNLDFKFISANALLPIPSGALAGQNNKAIKKLFNDYFSANSQQKPELKYKINELIITLTWGKELIWQPFDMSKSASFFDGELMFAVDKGLFSIIIGNPPYIKSSRIDKKLKNTYVKKYYKETMTGNSDLYVAFFERGMKLLKEGGILTYITSNKWLRAKYGENLKQYFLENKDIVLLNDLGSGIFKSATVDAAITIVANKKSQAGSKCLVNKVKVAKDANMFLGITDDKVVNLKQKIESKGKALKDWDVSINYGIKTGYNEAFIIDQNKYYQLIAQDPKSKEILKPLLRGKDIKRYEAKWARLYLVATHNGYAGKPRVNIDDYPAVKAHLDQHWVKVEKRDDQGATPYNLRSCAYYDEFSKPKIVYGEICQEAEFHYDEDNFYPEATSFLLTGDKLKYLLALLNSKACTYAFKTFYAGGGLGNTGYRYKKAFIENLPISIPTPSQEEAITNLVNQIIEAKQQGLETNYLENEIDKLVYRLYNLSEEEVAIIELKN